MRDDHHVAGLVAVFVVGRSQLLGEPGGALVQVMHGLTARGSRVGVGHPAAGETGEGRVYRHRRGALEDAEAALRSLPSAKRAGRHAGERRGGLPRAAQVAAYRARTGWPLNRAAVSAACRRPRRVSSVRSLWPWARLSVFQVLSPCLTR